MFVWGRAGRGGGRVRIADPHVLVRCNRQTVVTEHERLLGTILVLRCSHRNMHRRWSHGVCVILQVHLHVMEHTYENFDSVAGISRMPYKI